MMSKSSLESRRGNDSKTRFGLPLCDYCNSFFSVSESKTGADCEYHPTLNSLHDAIRSGCQFCMILQHRIQQQGSVGEERNMKGSRLSMLQYHTAEEYRYTVSFNVPSIGRAFYNIVGTSDSGYAYPGTSRRENVLKELGSMQAYHVLDYTPPGSTDGLPAWKLCRSWVENCIKNHERCKSHHPDMWHPTRLLYIGGLGDTGFNHEDPSCLPNIELHLTRDKRPRGPYMTLSHCWGNDIKKMLRLTADSYKHRIENGFSLAEFPKTFQDAIRFTRFLGCDYIWIDSLCIIQQVSRNDQIAKEDWIRESKIIADVYRHSKCNIAATASQGPTDGCFYPRNVTVISPLAITFRGEKHLFFNGDIWDENVEDAPLNKRAWVMQERILAPRQIHCGREQLLWECHQTTACETFPFIFEFHEELYGDLGRPLNIDLTSLNLTLSEISRLRASNNEFSNTSIRYPKLPSESDTVISRFDRTLPLLSKATREERIARMRHILYQDWVEVIEGYSSCALSHRSDKLVAILGIASRIQHVLEDMDEYVAGLWQSQLPWQLLWRTKYARQDTMTYDAPSYDIGPSWSWASLTSPISWDFSPSIGWESKRVVMINILDVHDGHTIDKGAIDGKKESPLELRCLLYKIHNSEKEPDIRMDPYKHGNGGLITVGSSSFGVNNSHVFMDSVESLGFWEQAYVIPVSCEYFGNEPRLLQGLIVSHCQERPGFYKRIAMWDPVFSRLEMAQHMLSATDKDKITITLI